ncbi:MAG: DUF4384 domain-containing protein [Deltaproteobacteria bacterium]|nr:DUF4384 domain-containing protein [Deltaproteobacteria bacterium]
MSSRVGALTFVTAALFACGGTAKSPGTVACPSGPRVMLECGSEIAYQGVKASGEVHVLNITGAKASLDERALRAVNEQVERYVAAQTRLCREYNACVIDADRYHADAKEGADRLTMAGELAAKIESAKTTADLARASDALYETFVPRDRRVQPLELRMTIEAQLPSELGSGGVRLPPNHPVPTGAKLSFLFEVSRPAFLYLFQVDPKHRVDVLFPDARLQIDNPLRAGVASRIPDGAQSFRVDERGLGVERVFVVASASPIPSLQQSLARIAAGHDASIASDPLLDAIGTITPGPSAPCARPRNLVFDGAPPMASRADGCARSRGIVLDDVPPPTGVVAHSMTMRTLSGDDTLVKVFPFQHVAVETYRAEVARFSASTPEGARARGIVVE